MHSRYRRCYQVSTGVKIASVLFANNSADVHAFTQQATTCSSGRGLPGTSTTRVTFTAERQSSRTISPVYCTATAATASSHLPTRNSRHMRTVFRWERETRDAFIALAPSKLADVFVCKASRDVFDSHNSAYKWLTCSSRPPLLVCTERRPHIRVMFKRGRRRIIFDHKEQRKQERSYIRTLSRTSSTPPRARERYTQLHT